MWIRYLLKLRSVTPILKRMTQHQTLGKVFLGRMEIDHMRLTQLLFLRKGKQLTREQGVETLTLPHNYGFQDISWKLRTYLLILFSKRVPVHMNLGSSKPPVLYTRGIFIFEERSFLKSTFKISFTLIKYGKILVHLSRDSCFSFLKHFGLRCPSAKKPQFWFYQPFYSLFFFFLSARPIAKSTGKMKTSSTKRERKLSQLRKW